MIKLCYGDSQQEHCARDGHFSHWQVCDDLLQEYVIGSQVAQIQDSELFQEG